LVHLPKIGPVAFMMDERLPREKAQLVMRVVNSLRHVANIDVLDGSTEQDVILRRLEKKEHPLVIVPWYRYLAWSRIEAQYGLTRTTGPTFAGYFADQVQPYEVELSPEFQRAILLDFSNLHTAEASKLLQLLLKDQTRYGLRPLFDPRTGIFCETWYGGQGLGNRMDSVLELPIVAKEWTERHNAIRIALTALRGLVYDEGPGKGELARALTARSPKGYFQVAADAQTLALRLCYAMGGWAPKDALQAFWPQNTRPTSPAQLLLRHADALRVHTVAETPDLEVVALFFKSAPAEAAPQQFRTLWIEPLAAHIVTEAPYEAPGPESPQLRLLPGAQTADAAAEAAKPARTDAASKAKDRMLYEAALKLRDLRKQLEERDELIRELRSGGVGTAKALPPPDAESLLEAFQQRYGEARLELRQLELQVADAEKNGIGPQAVDRLRRRMADLAAREATWIRQIAALLEQFKKARGA
jgi:hypothetical protein